MALKLSAARMRPAGWGMWCPRTTTTRRVRMPLRSVLDSNVPRAASLEILLPYHPLISRILLSHPRPFPLPSTSPSLPTLTHSRFPNPQPPSALRLSSHRHLLTSLGPTPIAMPTTALAKAPPADLSKGEYERWKDAQLIGHFEAWKRERRDNRAKIERLEGEMADLRAGLV